MISKRVLLCLLYTLIFTLFVWPGVKYNKLTKSTSIQALSILNTNHDTGRKFCLSKGISIFDRVEGEVEFSSLPKEKFVSCQFLCGKTNQFAYPIDYLDKENFSNIKKIVMKGALFLRDFRGEYNNVDGKGEWFFKSEQCAINISSLSSSVSRDCNISYNYFQKEVSLSREEVVSSIKIFEQRLRLSRFIKMAKIHLIVEVPFDQGDLCEFGCCESSKMNIILNNHSN
ncbi:hypothetical protein BIY24_13650 [Halobacteriovorax marinus]|uniref:hypothetical protein n=1 Tax=Halobacteriovorax marinus TaxID=97084 RepID=UPI000BC34434|nr:hypothetical protein [Halobacteriovorax marinus]ATH08953.1 hypothetical protein BIY24_13650 [Halobacteriovorax marinus]